MKKSLIVLFTLAFFFIVLSFDKSIALAADGTSADTNDFTWKNRDGGAEITGYTGTDTVINIPSKVNGLEVISIGRNAFEKSKVTSVTIPGSVKVIGAHSFRNCYALRNVTIAYGVVDIEAGAFDNCYSLKEINIPNSVTHIGGMAFADCDSLPSINIPSSVTSIDNEVFYDSISLKEINVDGGNQYFSSEDGVLFNKDKTTLITYPQGKSDKSYVIPSSVTSIEAYGFFKNFSLTNITFSENINSIGELAFYECDVLTSVNLPNGLVSIGFRTFENCSALASVTIPNSVTSIGAAAFSYCISLTSITIPDSVKIIEEGAFGNCYSLISMTIPYGVTSIGHGTFVDCESLTDITIPSSVTSIGFGAFYGCTALNSITIPSSVISIDEWAFYGCFRLTQVIIPNSVTSIGEEAFLYCSDLIDVTILNSDTSIGTRAFDTTTDICGYIGSKAQSFAASNGNSFIDIERQAVVTFNSNGGSLISAKKVNKNTKIEEPTEPSKDEHSFGGWYQDVALKKPWKFTTDKVTNHITLYAKWIPYRYEVYFDSEFDIVGDNTITADYNTAIKEPVTVSHPGFQFAGWYKDSKGTTAWNFKTDVIEGNTQIYAKWIINTYKISFDTNGGSTIDSKIRKYSETMSEPKKPKKTGYNFVGWYTDSSLKNLYDFDNEIIKDTTLYAKWEKKTYRVTLDTNGGYLLAAKKAKYNTTITAPKDPVKGGYIFAGWFTKKNGGIKIEFPYKVTDNVTIYAHWKPLSSVSPTNVIVSSNENSITVSWSKLNGASAYKVYYGTSPNNVTTLMTQTVKLSTTKGKFIKGKTYYFKVVGFRWNGYENVYSKYSKVVKYKL